MADAPDAKLSLAHPAAAETDFGRFVAHWQPHVHRVAGRLLNWRNDLDDVVQDVFLAVLERPRRLSEVRDCERWLTTITLNACRARLRRERVWRTCFGWLSRAFESASTSHSIAEPEQDASRVRQAIADLPRIYREVIVLRYLEELSTGDIEAILHISAAAAAARLSRARSMLQAALPEFADRSGE